MAEFARVRDGVVRPISGDLAMKFPSDDTSHLLVVSEQGKPDQAPGAIGLHSVCPVCEIRESHTMALRTLSPQSTAVIVIHLSTCTHKTFVRFFVTTVGLRPDPGCAWMADGVVDGLKERLSSASRVKNFSMVAEEFTQNAATDLQIFLNEFTGKPYRDALTWTESEVGDNYSQKIPEIILAKSVLTDIYTAARINNVAPDSLDSIQEASEKMDRAMNSISAWQTSRLLEAAQALAITAETNAKSESIRDRKIARLGAVTLFPMLYFAFLGSNIFPEMSFSFELPGWQVMAVALLLAPLCWVSAKVWLKRQYDEGNR